METKFKVQSTRVKVRESKKTINNIQKIVTIIALVSAICLSPVFAEAVPGSAMEERIVRFIAEVYGSSDDVQVRLNTIPGQLKENATVKNISFRKVPDVRGDGICMVEFNTGAGRNKNIQVPFRIFTKRKLFVLHENGRKEQTIRKTDVLVRETYMNGKGDEYPSSMEDLAGKVLKMDVPANTIITNQMLEDSMAVQRGEIVNIVAENKKILVSAKGKTIERGRIGDTVRVKNISSGKELVGRVIAYNTVAVDF